MNIYQTPKNLEAIRYAVVQRFIKLFSDKDPSILVSSSALASGKKAISFYFCSIYSVPCLTFEFKDLDNFKQAIYEFSRGRDSLDLIKRAKLSYFEDPKNYERIKKYFHHIENLNVEDPECRLRLAEEVAIKCLEQLDTIYQICCSGELNKIFTDGTLKGKLDV